MSPYSTELLIFIVKATALTAVAAYAIYWLLNNSPIARWLHNSDAVVPSFLSITSFIFGFAISTVASYSLDHRQLADSNLIAESNAIETIVSTATVLPVKDQAEIRSGIENYLTAVFEKEWPDMENKDANKREIATPEFLALNKIINDIAYQPNQRSSITSELLSALRTIRYERQVRQSIAYDNDSLIVYCDCGDLSIYRRITIPRLESCGAS
jgi:hypothetical protein